MCYVLRPPCQLITLLLFDDVMTTTDDVMQIFKNNFPLKTYFVEQQNFNVTIIFCIYIRIISCWHVFFQNTTKLRVETHPYRKSWICHCSQFFQIMNLTEIIHIFGCNHGKWISSRSLDGLHNELKTYCTIKEFKVARKFQAKSQSWILREQDSKLTFQGQCKIKLCC